MLNYFKKSHLTYFFEADANIPNNEIPKLFKILNKYKS